MPTSDTADRSTPNDYNGCSNSLKDCKIPYEERQENATGTQSTGCLAALPEVDEYVTFYPDATGLRHIVYTPKLESAYRKWHELMEMGVIAGSLTNPNDNVASPALTVLNLEDDADDYHLTSERSLDSLITNGRGLPEHAQRKDKPVELARLVQ